MSDGIQKDDIISNAALEAPLQMAKNVRKMTDELDEVIVKTRELTKANEGEEKSLQDVSAILAKLAEQEERLVAIQNKHAVQVNKLVETQKKQEKQIDELNKKLKEKKKNEEDNAKAVDALDRVTGGYISTVKDLGKEFLALASNPVFLTLAGLVGVFYALRSATNAYYSATGEGEDALGRKQAASQAAMDVLRNKWAAFGKTVSDTQQHQEGFWTRFLTGTLRYTFQLGKVANDMEAAAEKGAEAFDKRDALEEELIENTRTRQRVETKIAELTYKAAQSDIYSNKQRLAFRMEINKEAEGQLQTEIRLAEKQLARLMEEIALNKGITVEKLASLDLEQRRQLLTEENGKQLSRLTEAETKVEALRGDFFLSQRKNITAIANLKKEMAADEKKSLDELIKAEQTRFDNEMANLKRKRDAEEKATEKKKKDDEDVHKKNSALLNKFGEQWKARLDYQRNRERQDHEDRIAEWTAFFQTVSNFANAFAALWQSVNASRIAQIDAEKQAVENSFDERIKKIQEAENAQTESLTYNERLVKQLEEERDKRLEEFEKKKRAEMRKTAVFEKATALAMAGIQLSLAIIRALSNPIQVALTTAMGLIQIASIAAKPLPALFKGTSYWKGGPATVGERGKEWIKEPGKPGYMSPNHTTAMYLPEGTVVVPHAETVAGERAGTLPGWNGGQIVGAIDRLRKDLPDYKRIHDDLYLVRRSKEGSKAYIRSQIFV